MLKKKLLKNMTGLSLLLVLMAAFTFAAGAEEFPVTVVDDFGIEVTVEEKPERIISLAPSNTEMLFAVGLDEEIVGVTTFADYPEAAVNKEKIGSITEPNIEKIVSLEPDLIIAAGINKKETIDNLKDLGITVAGFYPSSIDDTLETFKKMGRLTGRAEESRKIVTDMYLELAAIKDIVDSQLEEHARPKVFYEIWSDPLTTAGEGSFIDDLIYQAGGINIGAEAQGMWPQFSLEKLLLEDPEVYISSPHSAPHQVTVETIKDRDNYGTLSAVENDRIYIVDQNIVSRPSPRIIKGLKLFVNAIFPELADEVEDSE